MTLTHTSHTVSTRPLEELYLRDGLKVINGLKVMVFVAHPDSRCEDCEWPLSNERKHPKVEGHEDLRVVCGGHIVRLA